MTDVAQAYVRLRPNSAGFQREAEAQLKGATSHISKALSFAIGAAGVGEGLKKLVEEAASHQSAVAQTQAAVKAAGAEWIVYGQTVEQQLDKQARATGFSFEELYQGFIRIETQVKNTPKALAILGEAEDVARARHLGLAQAATALSRASAGNVQSLSRLGIIVPKATQAQDALKAKLLEVTHAIDAQREAAAKHYVGTQHLTAAELELAKLSPIQLKTLAENIKAQEAQAKASDLQGSAAKALAEVQARYGGQASTYAKTAAGEYARFRVEVEEAAAELGKVLLPYLSDAAKQAGKWARELGESKGAAEALKTGAKDVASAVGSIGDTIKAVEPELKLLIDTVQAIGAGPILAAYAAYKTLAIGIGIASAAQTRFVGLTRAGQIAIRGEVAEQAVLDGEIAAQAAGGIGKLGIASEGLLATLSGPGALVGALALTAGAVYYLSTITPEGVRHTNDLRDAYNGLAAATRNVTTAQNQVRAARSATDSARDARQAAADALTQAKQRLDADVLTGKSADVQAAAAKRVTDAEAAWRAANSTLIGSEHAKKTAIDTARKSIDEQRESYKKLVVQQAEIVAFDAHVGIGARGANLSKNIDDYVRQLRTVEATTKGLTAAQKFQIESLASYVEDVRKLPSTKTVSLFLNDTQFYDTLQKDIGALKGAGSALLDIFTGPQIESQRGGPSLTVQAKKKGGELGKTSADAFTTSFVQTIDAGTIAQALTDAIASARGQLESTGNDLASAVAATLDARLAATEKRLNAAQKAIQDDISKRQAAEAARNATQTGADAAVKLKELQDVLGTGALTPDQQLQLQAAKNAVLDAQDAVANASDQAKSDAIDRQKTSLEAQNDQAKTSAARRIADLDDEFNHGLISQAKYIAGVRGLLGKERVNYKTTGALLGKAFSDGFRDSLQGIVAQSNALGQVGRKVLRATPTGQKAISPVAEEAKAIQDFIDQVAGSGGRFNIKNAGKLPAGVDLGALLSAANAQRSESAYREKTSKQTATGIQYAGETRDHTAAILAELKKQRHVTVHVTVDDASKKRKIAQATQ